ncbi:protein C19orf12 homolog [Lacerta agilis]|uniref:protein C19orf12 homolog n=1 Tax=Lacerta agilis TaxID=80427 RepID=UPI0014192132|nr:protein C19orf12 homolog [Lacerta agilis]XP_033014846.1 protein C19orf12 homolog [Lacerta agilis]
MSSITVHDMMQLLSRLSEVWGMTAASKEPQRISLLASLGAFMGGMLGGGPIGLAVGSTIGGLVGTQTAAGTGEFKPIRQILLDMSPVKQQQLYMIALPVIRHMEWPNAVQLMNLVMEDVAIQEQLIGVLMDYLANELKVEIKLAKRKP